MIVHPIQPVYNEKSKIMILGSFPSVKSREQVFFYGHPQNRFWKVLSTLLQEDLPTTIEAKRNLLLNHGIAVWDVIASCDIEGSMDNTIKNVQPNDLMPILEKSSVQTVFTNGKTAKSLYDRYLYPKTGMDAILLPSTSPANAAWSFERLLGAWEIILK